MSDDKINQNPMISEKARKAIFATVLLMLCSCGSIRELSTLRKCEFRLAGLEHFEVSGIRTEELSDYADLNLIQLGRLTAGMAGGDLPLNFTANIEVRNPNPAPAALNRLEYIAFIDDARIAGGSLDERVEIPPSGGSAVIPLNVSVNLAGIFSKESLNALFNLVLNLADAGDKPSRFILKVKPAVTVAGRDLNYPGSIRLSNEFISE